MCKNTLTNDEAVEPNLDKKNVDKKEEAPKPTYNLSVSRLFDPSEDWLLVENGSFKGHFDNIPKLFRVGPWNIWCCLYLFALCSWVAWNFVECYSNPPPYPTPSTTAASYYDTNTWQWWCNAAGFLWTFYIAYRVTKTEMGWGAWISYTLQSWTLIVARYALSTLAPFFPALALWNEYIRYAMLLQTTVTFSIWNIFLLPAILTNIKTQKGRDDFVKFCFGFLLSQLHLFNLPIAALNGIWGSPARSLNKIDFCVAFGCGLQYVLFYLFVLDRLGAHLYFIFSPRTPLALIFWSIFVGCQYAGFDVWNAILQHFEDMPVSVVS